MDDIVMEQSYPYTPEQVWEALTDPAALAEWLMPGDFKAVVGHRTELRCAPHAAFDGVVLLEVLRVDRPRVLSYSWKAGDIRVPTIVTYTLTRLPNGHTRLRLEHAGFTADNGRTMHPLLKAGWVGKLRKDLPGVLERLGGKGKGPGPVPGRPKARPATAMRPEPRMPVAGDVIRKNKEIVREFTRVFKNEHNVEGIGHLFAGDFRHHFQPPVRPGLDGFKEIGRRMNAAFPDVVVTEEDLIAADDLVVERSSAAATHRGSLAGEAPTNRPVRWTEIHIYRIRNEKIAEHWVEFARLELLQQIGALPKA